MCDFFPPSSSFHSSDGHSSLCDESSSTPQVLQADVELPGHWGGVGPGPLSEHPSWSGQDCSSCCVVWLRLAGALICVADAEFCVHIYFFSEMFLLLLQRWTVVTV